MRIDNLSTAEHHPLPMVNSTAAIKLYNTRTGQKELFEPQRPQEAITFYLCGPTVYNYAHIGNARSALAGDILARLLRVVYKNVLFIRNITDIDDKIIQEAQNTGKSWEDIARKFETIYQEDMAALGLARPDVSPRATEHLAEMIQLIEALIDKGFAYVSHQHVLFDIGQFPDYGFLSKRSRADMIDGARVEVAPYKRSAGDFVLWKPSASNEPSWPSPWGNGRPGWHIECSAMIKRYAGTTLDIHMGGQDLLFPHHENECAQSQCAHNGALLARFWVHNGFVNMGKQKMSKSLQNVLLVKDLLKETDGFTLRLALMSTHYRQPLDWGEKTLVQAKQNARRLQEAYAHISEPEKEMALSAVRLCPAFEALCDDMNTPAALGMMMQTAKNLRKHTVEDGEKQDFAFMYHVLGLSDAAIHRSSPSVDTAWIEQKMQERKAAKKAKDFLKADQIRNELLASGVRIEDRPDGSVHFTLPSTNKPPV